MYEIGKFMVYKFTVYCMVYSKLLLISYRFIVQFTANCCYLQVGELLHFFTVAQPISELLHVFTVYMYKLQHYLAFISLLLMELNYGL